MNVLKYSKGKEGFQRPRNVILFQALLPKNTSNFFYEWLILHVYPTSLHWSLPETGSYLVNNSVQLCKQTLISI